MKGWKAIYALFLLSLLGACATVRPDYPQPDPTFALEPATIGPMADTEAAFAEVHGSETSGFLLLQNGEKALSWLLTLIDEAHHSLDLQYYLWYADDSGHLILKRVLEAAKRGVRVRLITDGILLLGKGGNMAALDAHPNLGIRIFNPWEQTDAKGSLKSALFLERVNYRMHNKLIVADNRIAALGGRNLGNEYFGLNRTYNFLDLDVLGVGPMARQVSALFDHFWNSQSLVPGSAYSQEGTLEEILEREKANTEILEQSDRLQRFPLERQNWSDRLASLPGKLHPGKSTVLYDTLEGDKIRQRMAILLPEFGKTAKSEILICNAYVIPDAEMLERARKAVERGVSVRVLTNSLASQDMPAVHSHYGPLRKAILETGMELYELQPDAAIKEAVDTPPVVSGFVGLHTKASVVDRRQVFIGSFNLDPRSRELNTEMGVLIDSPGLGNELADLLELYITPQNSWRVGLDDKGKLYWQSGDQVLTWQPALSTVQRIQDAFFKLFPKDYL